MRCDLYRLVVRNIEETLSKFPLRQSVYHMCTSFGIRAMFESVQVRVKECVGECVLRSILSGGIRRGTPGGVLQGIHNRFL